MAEGHQLAALIVSYHQLLAPTTDKNVLSYQTRQHIRA